MRREDLRSLSSDGESGYGPREDEEDAVLRARLNACVARVLSVDLDLESSAPNPVTSERPVQSSRTRGDAEDGEQPMGEGPGEAEDGGFEFRLFSSRGSAPKIVLATDEALTTGVDGGGFVASSRPVSYYVKGEATAEERKMFSLAAITAADVRAAARQRNWGLEVPWRVTKLVVSTGNTPKGRRAASSDSDGADQHAEPSGVKRKRPGKKRRIALRIKGKADKERERQNLDKEEHLKEKKARLNREKKLKRRQKEREKKIAARGEVNSQGNGSVERDEERSSPD